MLQGYDWSLRKSLRHRLAVLIASILILVLTGYLFVRIPKGFLPSEDSGAIFAFTMAAQGTSFDQMKKLQQEVFAVVRKNPNVAHCLCTGRGGRAFWRRQFRNFLLPLKNPPSCGQEFKAGLENFFHIPHKPLDREYRLVSTDDVIQQLRPKLAKIPGILAFMQNPPPIRSARI